jgi:hypothetical protein
VSLLIGFGYRARQGKDLAVQAIVEARREQLDVRRYAFADELKREYTEACEKAGSSYELIQSMRVTHNLPDWVQYEFGSDMTDPLCPFGKQRTLLQWWGTEYRRAVDPFYWVKKLKARLLEDNPKVALISDMRFPNEALFIKVNGGYTVEVRREGFEDATASAHISEKLMVSYPFDIVVTAKEGAVEQLKIDAVAVFDMIVDWVSPRNIEVENVA